MREVGSIVLFAVSLAAAAECERLNMPPSSGRPDVDGPGSFGPLQGTLTLDCLRFVGYEERNGKPVAVLKDEVGETHRVRLRDFIGMEHGLVTDISPHTITMETMVQAQDGTWGRGSNRYLHRVAEE